RHTRFSRDWSSDVCSSDLNSSIASRTSSGTVNSEFAGIEVVSVCSTSAAFLPLTYISTSIFLSLPRILFGLKKTAFAFSNGLERSEERRVGNECRRELWL